MPCSFRTQRCIGRARAVVPKCILTIRPTLQSADNRRLRRLKTTGQFLVVGFKKGSLVQFSQLRKTLDELELLQQPQTESDCGFYGDARVVFFN
jgi:hypothetical protein